MFLMNQAEESWKIQNSKCTKYTQQPAWSWSRHTGAVELGILCSNTFLHLQEKNLWPMIIITTCHRSVLFNLQFVNLSNAQKKDEKIRLHSKIPIFSPHEFHNQAEFFSHHERGIRPHNEHCLWNWVKAGVAAFPFLTPPTQFPHHHHCPSSHQDHHHPLPAAQCALSVKLGESCPIHTLSPLPGQASGSQHSTTQSVCQFLLSVATT